MKQSSNGKFKFKFHSRVVKLKQSSGTYNLI